MIRCTSFHIRPTDTCSGELLCSSVSLFLPVNGLCYSPAYVSGERQKEAMRQRWVRDHLGFFKTRNQPFLLFPESLWHQRQTDWGEVCEQVPPHGWDSPHEPGPKWIQISRGMSDSVWITDDTIGSSSVWSLRSAQISPRYRHDHFLPRDQGVDSLQTKGFTRQLVRFPALWFTHGAAELKPKLCCSSSFQSGDVRVWQGGKNTESCRPETEEDGIQLLQWLMINHWAGLSNTALLVHFKYLGCFCNQLELSSPFNWPQAVGHSLVI